MGTTRIIKNSRKLCKWIFCFSDIEIDKQNPNPLTQKQVLIQNLFFILSFQTSNETDGFAILQFENVDVLSKNSSEMLEFLLAQIIPVIEYKTPFGQPC